MLPSPKQTILALVLAAAIIVATGNVIGFFTSSFVERAWRDANQTFAWIGAGINLLAQLAAIVVIRFLHRRLAGGRSEILGTALLAAIAYTLIALLAAVYNAALTPLLIAISNAAQTDLQWLLIIAGVVIPTAVAAAIIFVSSRGPHAAHS